MHRLLIIVFGVVFACSGIWQMSQANETLAMLADDMDGLEHRRVKTMITQDMTPESREKVGAAIDASFAENRKVFGEMAKRASESKVIASFRIVVGIAFILGALAIYLAKRRRMTAPSPSASAESP